MHVYACTVQLRRTEEKVGRRSSDPDDFAETTNTATTTIASSDNGKRNASVAGVSPTARYQYLGVEEKRFTPSDRCELDADVDRLVDREPPIPMYDQKTFADKVRSAKKAVKRNIRDYVVAVTGDYDASAEDDKYQARKRKKQLRCLAKKEFEKSTIGSDEDVGTKQRGLIDRLNPFKVRSKDNDDENSGRSQGARIFNTDKKDRKLAYDVKVQRYRRDKLREIEENKNPVGRASQPEPSPEFSYTLKMLTYTPGQAARDRSTYWIITAYGDNIVTLVNADDSLPCRTISLNAGYQVFNLVVKLTS